ncbi:hypothetical protein Goklo_029619 [Gossypium klotzschianum]|uniref:Uncharacterized protein n=1 Tax=Gossypium klotzschianum TaxID=34286 RepID=A0A7J8W8D4_9ROSI|nr:hypothetical protein [Gossypium klotzschianum]
MVRIGCRSVRGSLSSKRTTEQTRSHWFEQGKSRSQEGKEK